MLHKAIRQKKTSFVEIGEGIYAFTAKRYPNSDVIIGDESVMVIEAQATPRLARIVVECIRAVTDKPISYMVLTHYHAVRVLGAREIIMFDAARGMLMNRGQEDWDSEFGRFPRLFQGHEEIPSLTLPTTTFSNQMTVYLGKGASVSCIWAARIRQGMRSFWAPDSEVMFTDDILEYHSACYCGDGHFADWAETLANIAGFDPVAIAPGRGDALIVRRMVGKALARTADFVQSTYRPAEKVAARGGA